MATILSALLWVALSMGTHVQITAKALRALPACARESFLSSLTDEEATVLQYDWSFWARPNQRMPECLLSPSSKNIWLVLAGRGFGKTLVGAEAVIEETQSGRSGRLGLVGETAADVRDVIVKGESGILAKSPPWFKPVYTPSTRTLTWPNGAIATTYNATEPDQLRGPQHDFIWGDELAKWRYAQDTFDMSMMGLRLGRSPRAMFTTTPRPIKIVRTLLSDPAVHVTRGRTMDNRENLPRMFISNILRRYAGTRLGRQELEAEILDDFPGALWTRAILEAAYLSPTEFRREDYSRIVVGVDPATTSGEDADETGIVAVGRRASDGHGVVLVDASCRESPLRWAGAAVDLYRSLQADRIIGETNQGGEMVETTLRMIDPNIPYRAVHATKGKYTRAEPVSALYEQGRMHHMGAFPDLEDQMCQFTRDFDKAKMGFSPDHVDALVWAVTELEIEPGDNTAILDFYRVQAAEERARQERQKEARV